MFEKDYFWQERERQRERERERERKEREKKHEKLTSVVKSRSRFTDA